MAIRKYWRRIRYKLRMKASDLAARVNDIVEMLRLRGRLQNSILSDRPGGLVEAGKGQRWAILAVHLSTAEFFSVRNLCKALAANDYRIMVVSPGEVPKTLRTELLSLCHRLVERRPIGRDFGSYKLGIEILRRDGIYPDLEDLVLCNDSMFWPGSFGSEIERLNASGAAWRALFEHCSISAEYHAQSFYQAFSADILKQDKFLEFWESYRPFSDREHAIKKGEIGLTTWLVKTGAFPEVLYSAQNAIDDMSGMLHDRALTGPVLGVLSLYEPDLIAEFCRMNARLNGSRRDEGMLYDWFETQLRAMLDHRMTMANPTHGAGLILNVMYGAPIKRDICFRAGYTIGTVATLLAGFSPEDREQVFRALVRRGHRSQIVRYKSYLMDRGRL